MSGVKISRENMVIALAVACVLLAACLAGAVAFFTFTINDRDNTISSLKSQIAELNSSLTSLQEQVGSENNTINGLISNLTVLEQRGNVSLWSIIVGDSAFWLNRTVEVEGNISPFFSPGLSWPPWNYELNSSGTIVGVSWRGEFYDGKDVMVSGVVAEGQWSELLSNGTTAQSGPIVYFIQAETITPL